MVFAACATGSISFCLKRDHHDRLLFASLQSDLARKILERHGADPTDLDTVYVVEDYDTPSERLFKRSDAILRVVKELGGIWKIAAAGKLLPQPLRDLFYDIGGAESLQSFRQIQRVSCPSRNIERNSWISRSGPLQKRRYTQIETLGLLYLVLLSLWCFLSLSQK